MKKIKTIILLLLLLIPFMVNAQTCDNGNVKIKAIYRKDKTENVEELSNPTIDNKKINLNLKMSEVGDSITYKVLVQNQTNEDYELNESNILVNSEFFKYTLDTNDKVIKANTEKEIELKVVYNKEVDENKFVNGVYTDNQDLAVSLSNDNINTNPITKTNYVTIILFVLLMIQLILYFAWTKKTNSQTLILILTILLIPISTNALCKVDIQVESHVQIENIKEFCHFDGEKISFYKYHVGETIDQYFTEHPELQAPIIRDFVPNPDAQICKMYNNSPEIWDCMYQNGGSNKVQIFNEIYNEETDQVIREWIIPEIMPKEQGCYEGWIER